MHSYSQALINERNIQNYTKKVQSCDLWNAERLYLLLYTEMIGLNNETA